MSPHCYSCLADCQRNIVLAVWGDRSKATVCTYSSFSSAEQQLESRLGPQLLRGA